MALPVAVLFLASAAADLSTGAVLVMALAIALLGSFVASRVWERHFPNAELSFTELMIWSWYRLQKAEKRLTVAQGAAAIAKSHEEQVEVLHELTAALESKDPYTRGHSRRVERHCFMTGVAMGLPLKDVDVLRMAASLHDVGKIRIPNKVLHKPGRLSDDERALIEEHPVLGSQMVAGTGNEQIVATVRHHHERWDGKGYPDGKAGNEIPLFARIIAVADSYDAIRSNRSYRAGGTREKAVGILNSEAAYQFDPDVVEAFMTTLPARKPLFVGLMLLSQPDALWRYLKRLLQRFGSASLAPMLGVLGVVAFVASSPSLAPGAPVVEASRVKVTGAHTAADAPIAIGAVNRSNESKAQMAAERRDRKAKKERADRRKDERRRDARRADARAADRARSRRRALNLGAASGSAAGSGSSSSNAPSSSTARDGGGSGAGAGTGAGTVRSTDGSEGGGSAGGTNDGDGGDLSSVDDPNPKGNDCDGGANPTKGSRLHCN